MTEAGLELSPIHDEFGARVAGVDLSSPLDAPTFAAVDAAINRYSILLFEEQQMNDTAHLDFTRRFGPLEEEHVTYYGQGRITYIGLVGNVDADGNRTSRLRVRSPRGTAMWNT